jgi:integrase
MVDVYVDGERHRIAVKDIYNAGNARRWRERLVRIRQRIANGSFSMADEFPHYHPRSKRRLPSAPSAAAITYDMAADAWEKTLTEPTYAWSTIYSYTRINKARWRDALGERPLASVSAAWLAELVAEQEFATPKSYNNALMCLKCTFAHAAKMKPAPFPRAENPAAELEYLQLHAEVDPKMVYDLESAERLLAELLEDWGEGWANFFEFSFFGGGMRPSEQVALEWSDFDASKGEILVERARVMGRAKAKTKNGPKRWVKLSPRALEVLERQRKRTGKLPHQRIFAHDDGKPIHDRESPWKRWYETHMRVTKEDPAFHYRPPYAARHSSVTWHLDMGKADRWVARQHGHSVLVLHKVYAHWLSRDDGEVFGPMALKLRRAFGYPPPALPSHMAPVGRLGRRPTRRALPRAGAFQHRAAAR